MRCLICGKECTKLGISRHVTSHNISTKEYYDLYLKKPNEGICPICKKETNFLGISYGYRQHCSVSCKNKDINIYNTFRDNNPQKIEEIRERTKQTCLKKYGNEYVIATPKIKDKISNIQKSKLKDYDDLIKTDDVTKLYGTGWYQTPVRKKLDIKIIMKGRYAYIHKNELPKIINYIHSNFSHSKNEDNLVESIKSYYNGEIIQNTKLIIKPYQLDIWLPELNLAVEYNGTWYHSIEKGCTTNYHLMKSLLCREQNIRLVHIYEFEDFEQQKLLLKDLILGIDNYPKQDFNKNNLIENIPEPEIIYNERVTIYGAGKLYVN